MGYMTFKRWKFGESLYEKGAKCVSPFFADVCSFFWGTRVSMYGIAHAYITHLDAQKCQKMPVI